MNCSREREKGSVQVVEFTYVFPIVVMTVLLLMAFISIFSFYISSFYITEWAVEEAGASVGTDGRLYWQLSGHPIPEEKREKIEERFNKHVKALSFIPGVSFSGNFSEKEAGKRITAECGMDIGGKKVFNVKSSRKSIKPVEFARNVDLLQELEPDEGWEKALEDRFGHLIERDTAYEVF